MAEKDCGSPLAITLNKANGCGGSSRATLCDGMRRRERLYAPSSAEDFHGSGADDVGAGRGGSSRAAAGMHRGAAVAGGMVPATAEKLAMTPQQKGLADTSRRKDFDMERSSVTPSKTEADESQAGPTLQSSSGGVTFPWSLQNLGNTCFFNATMQALASNAEIVRK